MSLITRSAVAALAASALLGTAASTPALAAPKPPRYVVAQKAGQPLSFKEKAAFTAYVRRHFGVDLNKKPRSTARRTAKASWAGDYATFYKDANGFGDNFRVDSGYGHPTLWSENCILWWCTNFDDQISSVYTHGVPALLYSETNYRGSTYFVPANTKVTLPYWFNDITSSVWVYWN
jgi:hypothetical protein